MHAQNYGMGIQTCILIVNPSIRHMAIMVREAHRRSRRPKPLKSCPAPLAELEATTGTNTTYTGHQDPGTQVDKGHQSLPPIPSQTKTDRIETRFCRRLFPQNRSDPSLDRPLDANWSFPHRALQHFRQMQADLQLQRDRDGLDPVRDSRSEAHTERSDRAAKGVCGQKSD